LDRGLGTRAQSPNAQILWRTIYLFKLPRFEKKVRVALDWTLDLSFAKDFACATESSMKAVPLQSRIQETIVEKQIREY
jgi:NADH:ubiquinone reductase (H+-translocating)